MSSLNAYPTSQNDQTALSDLMTKTVSATEAKAKLSELIKWAVKNQGSVIVEKRGNPEVAIIPFAAYEEIQLLKERVKRQEALSRLEVLASQVQSRNPDLTTQEADKLADEITRAAIDSLVDKGEVRFAE